ncbi:MAG: hypothetical protein PHW83_13500 [Bacteroidales bacterium]|nr:hypothetical protein [Bacteroidales bacterium]
MSYVTKGYDLLYRIKEIINRKSFNTILVSLLTVFLFFGVMNVYAQEDESTEDVKINVDYEGQKEFSNTVNQVESGQDDMNTNRNLQFLDTAAVIISVVSPELMVDAETLQSNAKIPADMKIGLTGIADNMFTYAYSNAPSVNLIAHLGNEWVPGYEENATGIYAADGGYSSGYDELTESGITYLWQKFRDMAYVVFVIVMIVIGFMIMFRSKLGGQTLVTIGNTIPSVIVGLILVTFSFAIAGLIIDLGGLLTSFIRSMFSTGQETDIISIGRLGPLIGSIFTGSLNTDGTFGFGITSAITDFIKSNALGLGLTFLNPIAAPIAVSGVIAMGLIGILLLLIVLGIVLVAAIKLLIVLYKAYFGVLINVVIGPLQILIGSFPGQKHMITNWFLSVLRNVLVFPVVLAIVNMPNILIRGESSLSLPEKLTAVSKDNMDIGISGGLVLFFLRVGVLFVAAQAPKFIEGFLPPVSNGKSNMKDAMAGAKMGLSKIPLLGGLFK